MHTFPSDTVGKQLCVCVWLSHSNAHTQIILWTQSLFRCSIRYIGEAHIICWTLFSVFITQDASKSYGQKQLPATEKVNVTKLALLWRTDVCPCREIGQWHVIIGLLLCVFQIKATGIYLTEKLIPSHQYVVTTKMNDKGCHRPKISSSLLALISPSL